MNFSRRYFIQKFAGIAIGFLSVPRFIKGNYFWKPQELECFGNYDKLEKGIINRFNDQQMKSVTFKNKHWHIAAHVHLPADFDPEQRYAAIVCVHPGSSVKEQTAGLYAAKLAGNGFIAIAYDASHQGESGGEPRYLEDPATRVEDIRCAVDYLTTLTYIDLNRIGVLGICAGGGYAANAALTERRIKAVATVVATSASRAFGESDAVETLEAVGRQRTAEAAGNQPMVTNWTPVSVIDAKAKGIGEFDMLGAIDYYRTPRGEFPTSDNKLLFTSMSELVVFDAFHLAERYLTQPLLIIVGDKVGAFGSYRDGFTLFNKAASANKKIHIVQGASHYDLYDQPEATAQAMEQLAAFFKNNL